MESFKDVGQLWFRQAVDEQMTAAIADARHDIGLSLEEFNAIHDNAPAPIEHEMEDKGHAPAPD